MIAVDQRNEEMILRRRNQQNVTPHRCAPLVFRMLSRWKLRRYAHLLAYNHATKTSAGHFHAHRRISTRVWALECGCTCANIRRHKGTAVVATFTRVKPSKDRLPLIAHFAAWPQTAVYSFPETVRISACYVPVSQYPVNDVDLSTWIIHQRMNRILLLFLLCHTFSIHCEIPLLPLHSTGNCLVKIEYDLTRAVYNFVNIVLIFTIVFNFPYFYIINYFWKNCTFDNFFLCGTTLQEFIKWFN